MNFKIWGPVLPAVLVAVAGCATQVDSTAPGSEPEQLEADEAVGESQQACCDASLWSYGGLVPGAYSMVTPAFGAYGGNALLAYPSMFSGQLHYSTFDGVGWGTPLGVQGAFSAVAPAVSACGCEAVGGYGYPYGGASACDACGGDLYMAYPSTWTNQLHFTTFNGSAWATPTAITGAFSRYSPAFLPYGNTLNMAYVGLDRSLYVSSLNNGVWSAGVAVPDSCCSGAPSLGLSGNTMIAACGCADAVDVCGASYRGGAWSAFGAIDGLATPYTPALVNYGGGLNAFYVGVDHDLGWATYRGAAWGNNVGISGFAARGAVAVTPFGTGLAMAGVAVSGNGLWWGAYHR